jgi:uncharacterized protein YecE (DUF72 family)
MVNTKFYYGTAGWSYKDWVPNFYPKNQSDNFDWLKYYSRYFNCVEVNSSYYTYLNPKIVSGWIEKISETDDFTFAVKLHQDFTHKRNFDQQKINAVIYILEMLRKAEKFGGLLLQLPYSFSFNESNSNYVKKLNEIFKGFQCFIEVRHKSWLNKEAIELLEHLNLGYTTIDQPLIGEALPFEPVVINDKAYFRFHGRNEEAWKKSLNNFGKKQTYEEKNARYNYLYTPGDIVKIKQKIEPVLPTIKAVFFVFNNHPNGKAPAGVFLLINSFEEKRIDIPPNMIKAFPFLQNIALPV